MSGKKRGRPVGTRPKKSRDAAMYDLYVSVNGVNGRGRNTGLTTYLANKYGISKQAVNQAIKREIKRRSEICKED